MNAIVIPESYWANSQLSIARHFGGIKFNGHDYVIVDKRGHDVFECTDEAEKAGRQKAIEPGEPADLCRTDFVPIYRKLGRGKFLAFLTEHPYIRNVKQAREILKTWESKNASNVPISGQ